MKQTAQLFKALSDDTRLRILGLLLEGELCVCDLVAILDMPQSTVSRHLAYLRNSGLVTDNRQGVWMHYRLADGETVLHQDIFDLLRKDLAGLPQVITDQKALREYMSKKQATCR
ncbi:MAG: ArsR family transcriptional regulator [Gaiellales bacterium]|nr:MAG: ArsR family transcriptional regulator [Gaiellales bacterium]